MIEEGTVEEVEARRVICSYLVKFRHDSHIPNILRHQWESGKEFTNKLRSETLRLSSM